MFVRNEARSSGKGGMARRRVEHFPGVYVFANEGRTYGC